MTENGDSLLQFVTAGWSLVLFDELAGGGLRNSEGNERADAVGCVVKNADAAIAQIADLGESELVRPISESDAPPDAVPAVLGKASGAGGVVAFCSDQLRRSSPRDVSGGFLLAHGVSGAASSC